MDISINSIEIEGADMADNKYRDAKIHDWWPENEYKEYETILETVEGQLRLISTPYPKEPEVKP